MLDIAWSEYLFIAILALILLGPNEIPVVLRTVGRWVAKARQISNSFQEQISQIEESIPFQTSSSLSFSEASEEKFHATYPLPQQPSHLAATKLPQAYPLPWVH